MCNKKLCRDLHVIRLANNEPKQCKNKNITNSHTSSTYKDDPNDSPSKYSYQYLNDTSCWKIDDSLDYLNYILQDGKVLPQRSMATNSKSRTEQHSLAQTKSPGVKFSIILWIDEKNPANAKVEEYLITDATVKVDFCPVLSKAEEKILKHIDQIRSSSTFQIICRGYYKDEDKNPLNLLQFLNHHHLRHIPVLVFTQDKLGLSSHLENQAVKIGIEDWKSR